MKGKKSPPFDYEPTNFMLTCKPYFGSDNETLQPYAKGVCFCGGGVKLTRCNRFSISQANWHCECKLAALNA